MGTAGRVGVDPPRREAGAAAGVGVPGAAAGDDVPTDSPDGAARPEPEAVVSGGAAAPAAGDGGGKQPGGRAGRNLPAAIAVGVALGAVTLAALYVVKVLFLLEVVLAVGIGIVELARAFAAKGIQVQVAPIIGGMVLMVVGTYWGGPVYLLGAFALTLMVTLVWRMLAPPGAAKGVVAATSGYVRDASASAFICTYPALIAGFVPLLLAEPDGPHRIVVFIAVTVCSDIGGYTAGVLFGKHKMSPIISPKKTWEGFAGSALSCVICGALLVRFLLDGEFWQGALLGAVVVVFATLGDLIESVIKRDLGIKDMGTLLPGHGGAMDRLDSLLFTLVPVWVLLSLFV
ncbi:MAG: phosphatidate cytidylyltransferase [Actinomycetes bacterium]